MPPSWRWHGGTLYADLSIAFVTGMALFHWRSAIPGKWWIAALLLGAAWLLPVVAPVAFGYAALWLAGIRGRILAYNRFGDFSYGLYIYGWPVQMTLANVIPDIGAWQLAAMAIPVALACAALSWQFVEKPALALK